MPAEYDKLEAHLLSDTQRLMRMLSVATKLGSVYGSMTWDLVEFDDPVVALSDHPVVGWPPEAKLRQVVPTPVGLGALMVSEVRIPVSPKQALLLTWRDTRDGATAVRGSEAQAAELNAFTIAQAEKQWLYQPGTAPPAAVGLLPPLAGALFPGYGRIWAEMSAVRKEVTARLEAIAGELINEMTIVSVA